MEHTFHTPGPVRLYVEVGRGSVDLHTGDVADAVVEVTGPMADQVEVTHDGTEIRVVAPPQRLGFLKPDTAVHVRAVVPQSSECAVRTAGADVTAAGTWGAAHVKTASGEVRLDLVRGPVTVETGSGSVRITDAAAELRTKSGSGDVVVERVGGEFGISTGSGDIVVRRGESEGVLKTGSGDIEVARVVTDLTLSTGSGDAVVGLLEGGALTAKTGSGDVFVGVAPDIAVWTDITTSSGSIRSDLPSRGEPAPGAPYLEIRAKTASGDIELKQR